MNRDAMNRRIDEEVEHIPKHPKDHQSELRMIYNLARRRSLGVKAGTKQSAKEVLESSIASVHQRHPTAEVSYDKSFFGS